MAGPSPGADRVGAVVVTWFPDAGLVARLGAVLPQVSRLVIVANDGVAPALEGLAGRDRVEVIVNARNLGLAAALNQGLARLQAQGFAWFLLLDQDSVVGGSLVAGLTEVYRAFPEPDRVGLLVPNYRSRAGGRAAYPEDVPFSVVPAAVTSGSLVSAAALAEAGTMREELFIEGIDTDFCLRVRAKGRCVLASGPVLMTHGAGEATAHRFLGRTVLVTHHSAFRVYLQYRNVVWALRQHRRTDPAWARRSLLGLLKRAVLIACFETGRWGKARAILRGTWHGLRGRLGAVAPGPAAEGNR